MIGQGYNASSLKHFHLFHLVGLYFVMTLLLDALITGPSKAIKERIRGWEGIMTYYVQHSPTEFLDSNYVSRPDGKFDQSEQIIQNSHLRSYLNKNL